MADSFTANQIQGVFGKFAPVLDFATVVVTANNSQGVFGSFEAVLDEAAAAAGGIGADEIMAARQIGSLQPVQMATQMIAY